MGYKYVGECAIVFAKKEKRIVLEDPEVVRANYEPSTGYIYFITFEAKDKKPGTRKLYEAKVVYGLMAIREERNGNIHVRIFKVKSETKKRGSQL